MATHVVTSTARFPSLGENSATLIKARTWALDIRAPVSSKDRPEGVDVAADHQQDNQLTNLLTKLPPVEGRERGEICRVWAHCAQHFPDSSHKGGISYLDKSTHNYYSTS